MRRLTVLLLLLSLIIPVAAIATGGDVYIKDIDMVLTVDPSWICITKQTEAVDLQGTAFDSPAIQTFINGEIQNVKTTDNLHASILGYDEEVGMYTIRIISAEDESSTQIWDFADYSTEELEKEAAEGDAAVELYATAGDQYVVVDSSVDGIYVLNHLTVNNGRSIQIALYFIEPVSQEECRRIGRETVNGVQFTQKSPNPAGNREPEGFWGRLWAIVQSFIYNEIGLLGRGLFWSAVFAVGYGAVVLFTKLFSRRK